MNILSISTMFPSKADPIFGIFVKRRLLALSKYANITVIAPQPYFPFITLLEKYKIRKSIPTHETINESMEAFYPRFFSIPYFLKPLDGIFMFISLFFFINKLKKKGFRFDLIDAHIAYPDGFCAVLLKKFFRIPVTITLRGHDVNYLVKYPIRIKQVVYALNKADKVFAVSNALRLQAGTLGINLKNIIPATNGVDCDIFYQKDKKELKIKYDVPLKKKVILSIGYLVPRKGFDLIINALGLIRRYYKKRNIMLIIIGGRGGETYIKPKLEAQVKKLKLENNVMFVDQMSNEELVDWYNMADVFCLASSHEGWPNVILESIACEVPVVATNVWGIPEIIGNDKNLGFLVERNARKIAEALNEALDKKWDINYLRKFAESKSWDKTAKLLQTEMQKLIKGS